MNVSSSCILLLRVCYYVIIWLYLQFLFRVYMLQIAELTDCIDSIVEFWLQKDQDIDIADKTCQDHLYQSETILGWGSLTNLVNMVSLWAMCSVHPESSNHLESLCWSGSEIVASDEKAEVHATTNSCKPPFLWCAYSRTQFNWFLQGFELIFEEPIGISGYLSHR